MKIELEPGFQRPVIQTTDQDIAYRSQAVFRYCNLPEYTDYENKLTSFIKSKGVDSDGLIFDSKMGYVHDPNVPLREEELMISPNYWSVLLSEVTFSLTRTLDSFTLLLNEDVSEMDNDWVVKTLAHKWLKDNKELIEKTLNWVRRKVDVDTRRKEFLEFYERVTMFEEVSRLCEEKVGAEKFEQLILHPIFYLFVKFIRNASEEYIELIGQFRVMFFRLTLIVAKKESTEQQLINDLVVHIGIYQRALKKAELIGVENIKQFAIKKNQ
jgi:hypothetical protein